MGDKKLVKNVFAAVITHNPDSDFVGNLFALARQFAIVIVIDNGSSNRMFVIEAARENKCKLVVNEKNLGIATALNQAIFIARQEGCEWLATFDQDSKVPADSVMKLFAVYYANIKRDQIGILSMAHVDRALKRGYHGRAYVLSEGRDWRLLRATITSGSFLRISAILTTGLFDEKLFIDAVDHDLCLRLRQKDWLILESKVCILEHSIGNATSHRILGREFACTHHSALRRYYMTRNHLEVSMRNMFFDPKWSLKNLSQLIAGNVVALLYENKKASKFYSIFLGALHFLFRRFGPR